MVIKPCSYGVVTFSICPAGILKRLPAALLFATGWRCCYKLKQRVSLHLCCSAVPRVCTVCVSVVCAAHVTASSVLASVYVLPSLLVLLQLLAVPLELQTVLLGVCITQAQHLICIHLRTHRSVVWRVGGKQSYALQNGK